mmetsp:Transcript_50586/g.133284  ORF Transcript_50586/g.133284 Transcript_50586/m.133284 type:complete len:204 (-) Transcript_50586:100-711(-)
MRGERGGVLPRPGVSGAEAGFAEGSAATEVEGQATAVEAPGQEGRPSEHSPLGRQRERRRLGAAVRGAFAVLGQVKEQRGDGADDIRGNARMSVFLLSSAAGGFRVPPVCAHRAEGPCGPTRSVAPGRFHTSATSGGGYTVRLGRAAVAATLARRSVFWSGAPGGLLPGRAAIWAPRREPPVHTRDEDGLLSSRLWSGLGRSL